jgi:hypothetical protein
MTMTEDQRDEKLMQMHGMLSSLTPMVKDHHATLYGNGQPGVKDRLIAVETKMSTARSSRMTTIAAASICLSALTLFCALMGWIG